MLLSDLNSESLTPLTMVSNDCLFFPISVALFRDFISRISCGLVLKGVLSIF